MASKLPHGFIFARGDGVFARLRSDDGEMALYDVWYREGPNEVLKANFAASSRHFRETFQ